jgi:hypothetical protein
MRIAFRREARHVPETGGSEVIWSASSCKQLFSAVIPNEARNPSSIVCGQTNPRGIPRFARNDGVFVSAKTNDAGTKPDDFLTWFSAGGSFAVQANYLGANFSEELKMLKMKIAFAFAGLTLLATGAGAQTKISGTIQCAKPESETAVPVNDRPGHAFVVSKVKCVWTKPLELAGIKTKTGEDTVFSDANGAKTRDTGIHVSTMENGDQFVVKFTGTSMVDKTGPVQTQMGQWSFVSGAGRLKGLTGKGTFKGKGNADGSVTSEIEGEYQIVTK